MNWKKLLLSNIPRGGDGASSGETSAADTEGYGLGTESAGGGLTAENTGNFGALSDAAASVLGEAAAGNFGYSSDLSGALGPSDFGGFGLSGITGLSSTSGLGPSVSAPFGGALTDPTAVSDYEGPPGMGLGGTSLGFSGFPGSGLSLGNMTPTAVDVSMEQPFAEDVAQASQRAREATAVAQDLAARAFDDAINAGRTVAEARAAAARAATDEAAKTQSLNIATQVSPTLTNQQIAAMFAPPEAITAPPSAPVSVAAAAPVAAAPAAPPSVSMSVPEPPSGRPTSTTPSQVASIGLTDVLADPSKMGAYLSERLSAVATKETMGNLALGMIPGVGPVISAYNLSTAVTGMPTAAAALGSAFSGPAYAGVAPAGEDEIGGTGGGMIGGRPSTGIASLAPPASAAPTGVAALGAGTVAPVSYNLAAFQPSVGGIQSLPTATPSPAFNIAAPLSRPQYV